MNPKSQKIIINIEGRNYPNWKIDLKNKLKSLKSNNIEIDSKDIDLSCTDISEIIAIANQYNCKILGFYSTSSKTIVSSQSLGYKSQLIIDYEYDPSLIGGLTLQVGSTMVDTSIKTKLKKLEKNMLEA